MHGHQAAKDKASKQREQANQVDLQVTMRDDRYIWPLHMAVTHDRYTWPLHLTCR